MIRSGFARAAVVTIVALLASLGLAGPPGGGRPVISYVTQPVRHWETFFCFGEGFEGKKVQLLRGELADPRSPDDLARALLAGEVFRPPQTPPKNVGDLYGRQHLFSRQVIGGKLQGGVQVFWVRTDRGLSAPYVVNRPEVFFVEFDEVAPGRECRLFGRNMVQSFHPPRPSLYLIDRTGKRTYRCQWGNRYDYQGHLNYQLPYELRFKVPPAVPDGTYELWVHNGLKTGLHGWGGPVRLRVKRSRSRPARRFEVAAYGARGDGRTDETAALERAVLAAATAGGGVVCLGSGDYLLGRPLRVPPGVHLRGRRARDSRLVVRPKSVPFENRYPADGLRGKGRDGGPLFRKLPTPPMVHLISRSRVEALGFVAREPVYYAVAASAGGKTIEDVSIRDCDMVNTHAPWITGRYRPATACIALLGHARHCEILRCRLRGMNGIWQEGTGTRCRQIDNRFSPPSGPFGTTGMGWIIGVHCVIEGNVCENSNRGFTCGPWKGPIERNFIARNAVVNGGSVEGAGESFLFEGPDVGRETWFGRPSAAGDDWLEQTDQSWKPGVLAGRVALVVHGRGFGQWRRVRTNTARRVTLARPWAVPPDASSRVVVRQFFMQNVLLNNTCRETLGGIEFYGGALENTVDRFVGRRAGAVYCYGANVADPAGRMPFGPCWYNDARNCRFLESRGAALQADRRTDSMSPAPLLVGNRFQNNEFRHSPVVAHSRVLLSLKQTSWLGYQDPRRRGLPPAIAYNVIDSSHFDLYSTEKGIVLDRDTTGTLLWHLRWPDGRPHVADAATRTVTIPH